MVDVNVVEKPLTHAEEVVSLISNSGVTRYRITAKVLDQYPDYMLFPERIYVEQFDDSLHVVGSIEADTAYYYQKKELFRLIGHVDIQKPNGDYVKTSELYWNRQVPEYSREAIYTDSFAIIMQNGNLSTTVGFRTNKQMDDYVMYQNSTEFEPPEETEDKKPNGKFN
ncbi:LPS export ABC transporter periplasmic protein LptC [Bacteroidia bacterium]|nr:LPS export ABC transporter periplasmic protein LptC [Bacteroidia bacterium]